MRVFRETQIDAHHGSIQEVLTKVPFPIQTPLAFTKQAIENILPNQMGCYGILSNGTMIYIGKGDIRTRMLAYFNGDNPLTLRYSPTAWVSEVSDALRMNVREKALIFEYRPTCNQRVG